MARQAASVKSLKALSRTYPDLQDFLFIIGFDDGKEEQPDRITAIVAGALLDMFLEIAIMTRFIPLSVEDGHQLFIGNSPLSTLSAKIKLGHALGLYNEPVREEMDNIREIRNAFAHTVGRVTFDMDEVSNVCERLIFPRSYPPDDPKVVRSAKQKFTLSARICWMLVSDALHWRTDLVTLGPFLARIERMRPELTPWLKKSPQPRQPAFQTGSRKPKKPRVRRRASRE